MLNFELFKKIYPSLDKEGYLSNYYRDDQNDFTKDLDMRGIVSMSLQDGKFHFGINADRNNIVASYITFGELVSVLGTDTKVTVIIKDRDNRVVGQYVWPFLNCTEDDVELIKRLREDYQRVIIGLEIDNGDLIVRLGDIAPEMFYPN